MKQVDTGQGVKQKTQQGLTCNKECKWLAEVGYHEARGESDKGVAAVMHVVLNRKNHDTMWPATVSGVVTQKAQFSYRHDGSMKRGFAEKDQYKRMVKLAKAVVHGKIEDPTDGAVFYHTKAVKPGWSKRVKKLDVIGSHIFYKLKES